MVSQSAQTRRQDDAVPPKTLSVTDDVFEEGFAHAPLGLIIRGLDGKAAWVNPAICSMLGYSEAELLELPASSIMTAEDVIDARRLAKELISGETDRCRFERTYVRKNGEAISTRALSTLIRDPDGKPLYFVTQVEDVSQTKKTRYELLHRIAFDTTITRMATEFVNVPFDEIDDAIRRVLRTVATFAGADRAGVFLLDEASGNATPSHRWAEAHLAPLEEAVPTLPIEVVSWAGDSLRRGAPATVNNVLESADMPRAAYPFTVDIGVAALVSVPMMHDDELGGFVSFAAPTPRQWDEHSVTLLQVAAEMIINALDRKAREEALRESGQLHRLVTKLATEFINLPLTQLQRGIDQALPEIATCAGGDLLGVFLIDERTETVRLAHSWFGKHQPTHIEPFRDLPAPNETLTSRTMLKGEIAAYSSVADLPKDAHFDRGMMSELGLRAVINIPMIVSSGVVGWIALGSIADEKTWRDDIVDLLQIVAEMFANAFERKRDAERAELHQQALAHALRVGTMGELATGLAHELNQPLAAISNYARGCERRLRSGSVDVDELLRVSTEISDLALHAGDVIRRLRAHVRRGGPSRDRYDLGELIADVTAFLSNELKQHTVALIVDHEALPIVQVDAIQIEQVFLNLIRNAIESIASTAEGDLKRSVHIRTRAASDRCTEVSVSDTGRGFDPADAERIFEQFHTTKDAGLGLGLSISRSIIEAHGGRLWAVADGNTGATFCFTLPLAHGDSLEGRSER